MGARTLTHYHFAEEKGKRREYEEIGILALPFLRMEKREGYSSISSGRVRSVSPLPITNSLLYPE